MLTLLAVTVGSAAAVIAMNALFNRIENWVPDWDVPSVRDKQS